MREIIENIIKISELTAQTGKEIGGGIKECYKTLVESDFYKENNF